MKKDEFISKVNLLATKGEPFLFLIDFEQDKPFVCELSEAAKNNIFYEIKGVGNCGNSVLQNNLSPKIDVFPIAKAKYLKAFELVGSEINKGNSYLLNLTFPTKIETEIDLKTIFQISDASYKLQTEDFVLFSPECFIKIENNKIFSFPMKGTIDASIPDAESVILNDKKEIWEHNTIVDLIRNDISIVARNVEVTRFRYVEKISTNKNDLLQISSEIRGDLPLSWKANLGEILMTLLPAGSISGAPKKKTVEIIEKVEGTKRGFFTGVFGVFDGENLDSAVNIRFIEKTDSGLQFRSGGGVTSKSVAENEYNEMIDKVYVPII